MLSNIEKELNEKGVFVCKTKGNSMEPMLKEGRDRVVIVRPEFPLKKYDVPVYRRYDHFTMHRIIDIKKGRYIISGDNRRDIETDITDKDIVGMLEAFYQGDEYIERGDEKYLKYAKAAAKKYPIKLLRHSFFYVARKIKRLFRRVGKFFFRK